MIPLVAMLAGLPANEARSSSHFMPEAAVGLGVGIFPHLLVAHGHSLTPQLSLAHQGLHHATQCCQRVVPAMRSQTLPHVTKGSLCLKEPFGPNGENPARQRTGLLTPTGWRFNRRLWTRGFAFRCTTDWVDRLKIGNGTRELVQPTRFAFLVQLGDLGRRGA